MDAETLAIKLYESSPLWDDGIEHGKYVRWPIAWKDLSDYGHERDAKTVARRHATRVIEILQQGGETGMRNGRSH